jgi:hypothetical protein
MKNLFHLVAVFPAGVDEKGFEQVQHYDFYVLDKDLGASLAQILQGDFKGVRPARAAEIWGKESNFKIGTFVTPSSQLHAKISRHDHEHWARVQLDVTDAPEDGYRAYSCVHRGPTTLQAHFEEENRKRNPRLYGAPLAPGLAVMTICGELDQDGEGQERTTPPGTWGRLVRQDNPDQWLVSFPNGATIYAEAHELRDPKQYTVGTRDLRRVVIGGNWYARMGETLISGPVLAGGALGLDEAEWVEVDLERIGAAERDLANTAIEQLLAASSSGDPQRVMMARPRSR